MKKILYIRLLLLVTVFFWFTACSIPSIKSGQKHVVNALEVNHVVLVWFKPDTTQTDIDEVIRETNKLPLFIPQIKSMRLGRAIASDRKMVDDSFDLGIYLLFANQQDMATYLSHPKHVTFVNQFVKPRLERLLVYDF